MAGCEKEIALTFRTFFHSFFLTMIRRNPKAGTNQPDHHQNNFQKIKTRRGLDCKSEFQVQHPLRPIVPVLTWNMKYTSLLKFGNGKCNGIFEIPNF